MAGSESPEPASSPDAPPERSGLRRNRLIVGLAAVLLGGVGLILILCGFGGESDPIRLSNPRMKTVSGINDHIEVDYECREPADPATEYFLVVEHRGAVLAEEPVPGTSLTESGTLAVSVFGSRRAVAGAANLKIYVEAAPPSAGDRDRVSNVVGLK